MGDMYVASAVWAPDLKTVMVLKHAIDYFTVYHVAPCTCLMAGETGRPATDFPLSISQQQYSTIVAICQVF